MRISIRYKILAVVTALLVSSIGLYLLLATRIFKQDKAELVYDLNKSVVATLSAQVETSLKGSADKLKLFALIFSKTDESFKLKESFRDILTHDPSLVRLELYEQSSSRKMNRLSTVSEESFSKLYSISDEYYETILLKKRPIPFEKIQSNSIYVWNATIAEGPALLGMGIAVVRETGTGTGTGTGTAEKVMASVGYLKADLFLKNLKSTQLSQAFIISKDSKILVHPNASFMIAEQDFSTSPIVNELQKNNFQSGVMAYKVDGREQLGAFAKVGVAGIGIISQVDSEKAFFAVRSLVTRSILFALIIITATFIATIFFSRTLTRPLQKLLSAMEKVSHGELGDEVVIKSGDEIAVLASSFNQMTKDLKVSRANLEEVNKDLESKVVDRTKKLEEQNRAVQEAQEALLRTTRLASVGEIAGRTAHEVLNPLTSLMARVSKIQKRLNDEIVGQKNLVTEIIGAWKNEFEKNGRDVFFSSLSAPSTIDPQISLLQEDLANIDLVLKNWDVDLSTLTNDTQFLLQQAGRIEKILSQMRSLTAVSGAKSILKIHPIVHEAVTILGDMFAKNNVQLSESHLCQSDCVNVDRDELVQVLTNLLRNSLQSICSADQGSQRQVTVVTRTGSENKLFIDIVDTGVGISETHKTQLFKNQFTTKSKEEGTGLGLNISRRFVRNFNGDLYLLKSDPGRETIFRIELPLVLSSVAEVAA